MVQLLRSVIEKLYNILPDSPFQAMYDSVDMSFGEFIPFMNWFIPFDVCFNIMTIWLSCIAAYYIYKIIRKIIFDLVIGKLIK